MRIAAWMPIWLSPPPCPHVDPCAGSKKEKWVRDNQGQCVITAGQIVWTAECEKALRDAEGARRALKLLKKKWVAYLTKLTGVTRSKLNKIERNKVRKMERHTSGCWCECGPHFVWSRVG